MDDQESKRFFIAVLLGLAVGSSAFADIPCCHLGAQNDYPMAFKGNDRPEPYSDPISANNALQKWVKDGECQLKKVDCQIGESSGYAAAFLDGNPGDFSNDIKSIVDVLNRLRASGSCNPPKRLDCKIKSDDGYLVITVNGKKVDWASDRASIEADYKSLSDAGYCCPDYKPCLDGGTK